MNRPFDDLSQLQQVLLDAGLRGGIEPKAECVASAARLLQDSGANDDTRAWFVPGRIEVLGKHTDYCGGRSLVTAVERGICMVAAPRTDGRVNVHALDIGESVSFAWDPQLHVPPSGWRNYPMTVARRLARNFPDACRRGADLAFAADLPQAAGMSSSSALVIATYQALAAIEQVELQPQFSQHVTDDMSLAEYLGTHENGQSYGNLAGDRGVGTFGGSEDHTAILCSQAGELGLFGYCPTRLERRVRLPDGFVFCLGVSGVVAEKTGAAQAAYNQASERVQRLVAAWNAATGERRVYLADILTSAPDAAQRLRSSLGAHEGAAQQELETRLRHFELEDGLIDGAAQSLHEADLEAFGDAVDRSQSYTESMLGNQVAETEWLARSARDCGAVAASAFGAGFGGCVWALASAAEAEGFQRAWAAAYHERFPQRQPASRFLTSGAGPAAFELRV